MKKIYDFPANAKGVAQGDLYIRMLSDSEAAHLTGVPVKTSETADLELLEGEGFGNMHAIDGRFGMKGVAHFHDEGLAREMPVAAAPAVGTATLYQDQNLASKLPWLLRTDLLLGYLKVEGAPVELKHPEHDSIRLPAGKVYYVGRQIESVGAVERMVQD